jgi:hypothetical protein
MRETEIKVRRRKWGNNRRKKWDRKIKKKIKY